MQGSLPGIEGSDHEKVEIFISCRSLIDTETFSKTDPFVVMHMQVKGQWSQVFKTETIMDNLNPNFVKSYVCDYIFEQKQPMRIQVFHYNSPTNSELIGEVETSLAQIVGTQNSTFIRDVKNQKQKTVGKIILRAEKVVQCNDDFTLHLKGKSIKDMRFWTKSSPFLVFYRTSESKSPIKVHQTEVADRNLNPTYQPIQIKSQKLCNGDYQMPIIVEVWDYHSNGEHLYIGEGTFSIKDLVSKSIKTINLTVKKSKESAGQLLVIDAKVVEKPSFLDYIRGGTNLNLICAVDFTGSNGVPSRPESLHAIHMNGQLNAYQQAIMSVGEILLNYDEDKMVPFYGFGAKPKLPHFNFNQTLHCFPINGNPQQPDVFQLSGLMQAYQNFLQYVELSGPTIFNPLIQESMKVAEQSKQQNDQNYYILLILTDGEIHDMEATTTSIVAASRLPLSIIIIGIGNADFTNMEILDGDKGLVDSSGRKAERDLVQFVPYNDFKNDPAALARTVLEELPDQVVQYYTLVSQKPQAVAFQRMQSIQVPNIPQANQNFGQNLIKAGFMNNIIQGIQSQQNMPPPPPPASQMHQSQSFNRQPTFPGQAMSSSQQIYPGNYQNYPGNNQGSYGKIPYNNNPNGYQYQQNQQFPNQIYNEYVPPPPPSM